MAAEEVIDDTQITCRFITKLPQEYRVPGASVAVPSKLTRYGLSQIINHLLGLELPKPFDFLVNGELVRQSLEKFLLAKSISAESVLDIEYVFAVEPPKAKRQQPHDDWVSGVAVRADFIISGCYDGVLRCFQGTEVRSSTRLHSGPIKAVAVLPEDQGPLVLTAGQDHTVQLVHVPALDGGANSLQDATAVAIYRDHTDAVASVAPSPQGTLFVSSSWDSTLRVWPTGASVAQAAREAAASEPEAARTAGTKRRKDDAGEAAPSAAQEHSCRLELSGHSQCASSVAWPTADTIVSGSWDHSVRQLCLKNQRGTIRLQIKVRRWDAESAVNVDTFNGSKAVYCVAAAPDGGALVAFGGAERALHVWDPRTPVGQETSQKLYASHTDWISAVAWHPTSAHHVATASYDKTVKLWDLRTPVPLHTLQGHTDKVLCVAWARNDLVSGGADCTVHSYSVAV